jgi:hypothetical protein
MGARQAVAMAILIADFIGGRRKDGSLMQILPKSQSKLDGETQTNRSVPCMDFGDVSVFLAPPIVSARAASDVNLDI